MAVRPTHRLIGERGPEAVIPLHRLAQMKLGGGTNVNVSIGQIGADFESMSPSQQGRFVGDAFARVVRSSGNLRTLAAQQRRRL